MVNTEIDYSTKSYLSIADGVLLSHFATLSASSISKLQSFDMIWESQLKTPELALNVYQVINGLRQEDGLYHHLFHDFTAYANLEVFQTWAIINLGII